MLHDFTEKGFIRDSLLCGFINGSVHSLINLMLEAMKCAAVQATALSKVAGTFQGRIGRQAALIRHSASNVLCSAVLHAACNSCASHVNQEQEHHGPDCPPQYSLVVDLCASMAECCPAHLND